MKKKIEEIWYEKQDQNYYILMKINCLLSVIFFKKLLFYQEIYSYKCNLYY